MSKPTLTLDWDTADMLVGDILKHYHNSVKEDILVSAESANLAYHQENLRDYHRILLAIEEVYHYLTGEKL